LNKRINFAISDLDHKATQFFAASIAIAPHAHGSSGGLYRLARGRMLSLWRIQYAYSVSHFCASSRWN
jgi:hypothetical protein